MLTTEWNIEDAERVWKEEAREEGWEEGLEKGVEVSADIMRELIANVPIEEIAARYKVSVDKIRRLQSVLSQ